MTLLLLAPAAALFLMLLPSPPAGAQSIQPPFCNQSYEACLAAATPLENGVPQTATATLTNITSYLYFRISVPADATSLTIQVNPRPADATLHHEAQPNEFPCRLDYAIIGPWTCTLAPSQVQPGDWFLRFQAVFTGPVTVTARYETPQSESGVTYRLSILCQGP